MKIVVIGGEKGGTGKTTIATNLAAARAIDKHDTLLVDTDPQSSGSSWNCIRDANKMKPRISCIQKFGEGITDELLDLRSRYESIIVDAGGRDSIELRASMVVADLLVVPVQASQFDLWTLSTLEKLYKQVRAINRKLQVAILISRAPTNPSVKDIEDAKALVRDFKDFTLLDIVISDRTTYRRAAASGLSVLEYEPKNEKAILEVKALYNMIYDQRESTNE
ncbi:MAG: AAA family ATPase [Burkholderiales bacterium]